MIAREASGLHYLYPLEIRGHKCWKMQLKIKISDSCSNFPPPQALPFACRFLSKALALPWLWRSNLAQGTDTSPSGGAGSSPPLGCSCAADGCPELGSCHDWSPSLQDINPGKKQQSSCGIALISVLPVALLAFCCSLGDGKGRGMFWQVKLR